MFIFCVIIYVIIWCYHFSRSANACYHFHVIIFLCKYFVLSFMLSFDVIIYCYHFPPFFFFLKTWHTQQHEVTKERGTSESVVFGHIFGGKPLSVTLGILASFGPSWQSHVVFPFTHDLSGNFFCPHWQNHVVFLKTQKLSWL